MAPRGKPPTCFRKKSFEPKSHVTGRLAAHRDGFGFVIPDEPISGLRGDIFVSPAALGSALHGDRVLLTGVRVRDDGRAEGHIQRVLDRAQETIVGQFRATHDGNYVIPFDERIPHQIVIPKRMEIPKNKPSDLSAAQLDRYVVHVEITRFPSSTQSARGRILEILGKAGDFGVDVEIIIRKFHLPHEFSAEVQEDADLVAEPVSPKEAEGRRDFRDLPIVTIDGEKAQDFDDAVAVFPLPNGNVQLQVHIADVSHYVRPGTALDREARLRGTSVYFPDRSVPMLPAELSSGICSLKPQEDRLTLSVLIEIDAQGEVVDADFCEGILRSAARMTYTDVNLVLEGDPTARIRYATLVEHFERMRDLALLLNKQRMKQGAIDFDLPEPVIQLDEAGVIVSIIRSERNLAHRLIEEFMLTANEVVADYLEGARTPSIFRIHEKPDPQKVLAFEQVAGTFGYSLEIEGFSVKKFRPGKRMHKGRGKRSRNPWQEVGEVAWPFGAEQISPRHYQKLAEKLAGKPEEKILSYMMLRSLKQACYRAQNIGHFALATPCYTHFTSPIRRYPDLTVHRILRAVLAQGKSFSPAQPEEDTPRKGQKGKNQRASHAALRLIRHTNQPFEPIAPAELDQTALESSEAERRAQDAERELVRWKMARFMRDRLGEEFAALIISVTKSGFFVELTDIFVEGFVPIETQTDQNYLLQESTQQWVGQRTRRRFRLGDRPKVRLDRLGELGGKMSFSVVD
jgi:ribonuclease R